MEPNIRVRFQQDLCSENSLILKPLRWLRQIYLGRAKLLLTVSIRLQLEVGAFRGGKIEERREIFAGNAIFT